jgi:hypothetical protein
MHYALHKELGAPAVPNFHFFLADGTPAFVAVAPNISPQPPGNYMATTVIPGNFFNEGAYRIGIALTTFSATHHEVHFNEQTALTINVRDPRDNATLRYGYAGTFLGAVRPRFEWRVEKVS